MKTDIAQEIPLGTESEEITHCVERLQDHLQKHRQDRASTNDISIDLAYLADPQNAQSGARGAQIAELVAQGIKHIASHDPEAFKDLLIKTVDKTVTDSKMARTLTSQWIGQHAYASLEDRATMFPEMYEIFKNSRSVNLREAAGNQILSSCFQHATSDARLSEIKGALSEVLDFATGNKRRSLMNATAAKLADLRTQERELERSLG